MDGVHDLGGKQGFGPIDVNEVEVPFHTDWEGRMWAINQCSRSPDWTIDWWRHVRELIDPVDYLSRPYFDSWAQTHIAAFIDSGTFTLEEIIAGKSATAPVQPRPPGKSIDVLAAIEAQAYRFDREIDAPPAYQAGDRIITRQLLPIHHTRLPAYARGKPGVIHAHHGAHIFADSSAQGKEQGQHIYSVVFEARDLWVEAENKKDRVFLDLWESYLDPA
jgi:nitrile hydratase beta subunit